MLLTEQIEGMPAERLRETLAALRAAARFRHPETGARHFAHLPAFRAAFVRGILLRRRLLRGTA